MKSGEILLLTSREIQNLLTLDECIGAVEHAFRAFGEGRAVPPAVLSMHTEGGGFHVKAGLLELDRSYFAAKVNGNFPENSSRFGLPTIQGVIVLCDAGNGTPLAVMDSRDITSLRTAAATAVAAKYLARPDSRTLTICGCGNQGRVQLRALSRVCHLEIVFAYDRDGEQALRFSQDLTSELKIPVKSISDLTAAVRQSDICVTCTTSRQPLLGFDDVSPGTFMAAVGADSPQKQELHPNLMARSKIVVRHPRPMCGNGRLASCVGRRCRDPSKRVRRTGGGRGRKKARPRIKRRNHHLRQHGHGATRRCCCGLPVRKGPAGRVRCSAKFRSLKKRENVMMHGIVRRNLSVRISTTLAMACLYCGSLGGPNSQFRSCKWFRQQLETGRGCDGPSRPNAAGGRNQVWNAAKGPPCRARRRRYQAGPRVRFMGGIQARRERSNGHGRFGSH